MDGDPSWQARHDELRARLQQSGNLIGDKEIPAADREQAAEVFVNTWQEFCRHLREHPDLSISTRPR